MPAATDAREVIREQILALTSEVRNIAEVLAADPADPTAVEAMQRTSRSLIELAKQNSLQSLVQTAAVLERLPPIADVLRWTQPAEIPAFLEGADNLLGTIEELLDWCIEEADPPRQARLVATVHQSFSDRWRKLLEADSEAFERSLKSLTRPPATRPVQPAPAPKAPPRAVPQPPPVRLPAFDIPAELLETFEGEALERLQRCEELLLQLEQAPDEVDKVNALLRELHTLKGAAAEVGLDLIREQVHDGESLLALIRDGRATVEPSRLVDFFLRLLDSVRGILDRALGRNNSSHSVIGDVASEIAELLRPSAASAAATDLAPGSLDAPLADLAKLRERLGAAMQDPEVLRLIESLDRQARQYSQMAVGYREELDRLRLMPLADVLRRLLRPVRDASRQEGKRVQLKLHDGGIRVDREVAERLHDCLLHLVRNAVSHGIEVPVAREAAGKSVIGTVRVNAQIEGESLELRVQDDGAGIDFEAVRARAQKLGWLDAQKRPHPDELVQLIFRPGFSTRAAVDALAGRGVGMDVVARDVEQLKGRIDVESKPGDGTCFRLTLPLRSVGGAPA